ncbi:MAG: ECF-type sigma factor [Bryobacteraceae bacterium]|nr:ECF-type sigma factor [Bryobacteraceae bacterium]
MRRDLIDDARCRPAPGVELAARIDCVFGEMAMEHPEWCPIVELKYYLGLSDDEVANTLGSGLATLQRQWQEARWWIFQKAEAGSW